MHQVSPAYIMLDGVSICSGHMKNRRDCFLAFQERSVYSGSSQIDEDIFLLVDGYDDPATSRFCIDQPSRLFQAASLDSG